MVVSHCVVDFQQHTPDTSLECYIYRTGACGVIVSLAGPSRTAAGPGKPLLRGPCRNLIPYAPPEIETPKLPQRGPGRTPRPKRVLCIFEVRKKPSGTLFSVFLNYGGAPSVAGPGNFLPFPRLSTCLLIRPNEHVARMPRLTSPFFQLSIRPQISLSDDHRRIGDGEGRGQLPPPHPKKRGKNHVKFGDFLDKYRANFGHSVNFSHMYFWEKCLPKR